MSEADIITKSIGHKTPLGNASHLTCLCSHVSVCGAHAGQCIAIVKLLPLYFILDVFT